MFRKDIVINKIWEGLRLGVQLATDRENNILPDLSLLKTTLESHWWVGQCPVCNDSFRENDHVRKCPGCNQAYHDDPAFNLLCWHNHFAGGDKCINCNYTWNGRLPSVKSGLHTEVRSIATMEEQFFAGLSKTWEVFGDAKIHIVKPGDFMIGNTCPMCSYKLRLGDRVVKCPCSPKCAVYFHNDVPRNWTCWNEWNGEQGKDYCPVSSRKYTAKPTFKMLNY
jgi:hypothetical protein